MTGDIRPAFLLSLPRSGSTLLQRLLAAHSRIATVAEPWLLLPPLYALRADGVYAEYGHRTTVRAINGLLGHLPGGRDEYLRAVASMAQRLYSQLSPPGTDVFLDKSPRYGLVVEDLLAAFPQSPFIILHRSPLAVLASISTTFDGGRWKPYRHKQDLFLLSERLLAAQEKWPERFIVVRYEDIVNDPAGIVRPLIEALGLQWEPQIPDSFDEVSVSGPVGDHVGTRDYHHVSREALTKWRRDLGSPVRRAWAHRYLTWLGPDRLSLMGYDYQQLADQLDDASTRPSALLPDCFDAARGFAWSFLEVESTRDKLRRLPRWREVFTHD